MARFYGSIRGNRGEATRMGTPASGISGHIRGWDLGGSVEMHARGEYDTCSLLLTGGSNGPRNLGVEIAAFREGGPRVRYIVRLPGDCEVRGYVGDSDPQFGTRGQLDAGQSLQTTYRALEAAIQAVCDEDTQNAISDAYRAICRHQSGR